MVKNSRCGKAIGLFEFKKNKTGGLKPAENNKRATGNQKLVTGDPKKTKPVPETGNLKPGTINKHDAHD